MFYLHIYICVFVQFPALYMYIYIHISTRPHSCTPHIYTPTYIHAFVTCGPRRCGLFKKRPRRPAAAPTPTRQMCDVSFKIHTPVYIHT